MAEKRGRPQEPSADELRSNTVWRRLVETANAIGLDPRITSEIGRLRMAHRITDSQASAADLIGRVYGRWERLHGVTRSCRSPSYEFGSGGLRDDYENLEWIEKTEADYAAVQSCIPLVPRETRDIIELLCVENRSIVGYPVNLIYPVLNRVSVDFGLGPEAQESSILRKTRSKPRITRQERFESGQYAARSDDAKPLPGAADVPESPAARDREGLMRLLEARVGAAT